MIGYLRGKIIEVGIDTALVDVSGVGYEVSCSAHTSNDLMNLLKQYKKLRKRWKRVDTSLKVGGILVIGLTGITAAVTGVIAPPLIIPIIAPAVPIVLGVLSGAESIVLSEVVMGLTQRKKKFYLDKCNIS